MAHFGEFEFIAELLSPLAAEGAFGLTDDAAVLPVLPDGEALVVTKDAMVSDVHFRAEDDPGLIARKLIRTNLSDLAAMGAQPLGYMLAMSLTSSCDRSWLMAFCAGLAADQREFRCALYGGDTTSTPGPLTLSLTAFGSVERSTELRRNGARPGDTVWVTGTIGDAAIGLQQLIDPTDISAEHATCLTDRYWLPRPRITAGRALRGAASSCLDVSDGLLADLGHIARHSGCAIAVELDTIPLSEAAKAAIRIRQDWDTLPLYGGDDYELAFTLPPDRTAPNVPGIPFTRIGQVTEGTGVNVTRHGVNVPIDKVGWRHF